MRRFKDGTANYRNFAIDLAILGQYTAPRKRILSDNRKGTASSFDPIGLFVMDKVFEYTFRIDHKVNGGEWEEIGQFKIKSFTPFALNGMVNLPSVGFGSTMIESRYVRIH